MREEKGLKRVAFFDTKPYDKIWFDKFNNNYDIVYFENKLNKNTAFMTQNFNAVVAFVNDKINADTVNELIKNKVEVIALRCAGYNNVDLEAAKGKIKIVRVPEYSPYAVAEHAMALLLSLNRKIHRAYIRTRDRNFSLEGLIGFDLHGKTIGIIGTGKIGQVFINICKGFGMNVIAYDPFPAENHDINYVTLEKLFKDSDIISLHCPLTRDTFHIIDKYTLSCMKNGVYIINTSRGALIESEALVEALKSSKVGAAALDVYEEESNFFFKDLSNSIVNDDILTVLSCMPNVLITSHQAFFTNEALENIAKTTFDNLDEYFNNKKLTNEVKYEE